MVLYVFGLIKKFELCKIFQAEACIIHCFTIRVEKDKLLLSLNFLGKLLSNLQRELDFSINFLNISTCKYNTPNNKL